jgi:DNA-binding NtrC family response regulator/tetratricopeptide (TPR) repeat protein
MDQEIKTLARTGQFKEALAAMGYLPVATRRLTEWQIAEAELLVDVGQLDSAVSIVTKALDRSVEGALRVRALKILGQIAFYQGRVDQSRESLKKALEIAHSARDTDAYLLAALQLVRWRLFSKITEFELLRGQFEDLKRAVLASGAPEHLIELRACVAEVEAQRSSPHEALRHLAHARRMLESYPNTWLEGVIHNHSSNTLFMLGDLEKAAESSRAALECTDRSGHHRIRLAAQINLAQLLTSQGELDAAGQLLEQVVTSVGSHVHLRAAALDALSQMYLARGDVRSARHAYSQVLGLRRKGVRRIATRWDGLSELQTRARLLEAEGRNERALHLYRRGIRQAHSAGELFWENRLALRFAKLAAQHGTTHDALGQLNDLVGRPVEGPEMLAELSLARAATARTTGDTSLARTLEVRGARIATSLGFARSSAVAISALAGDGEGNEPANVQDSSALLELAGYPHVLAREAYALLELTGAVDAMALVARGEQGIRTIATHGWADAEARAAAAAPGDRLVIACGLHRDEAWDIVAELKPTLNDRCTAVAVRKLVDTAVTLDRYRREEKQRAALWPPDTLETDGGLWVSEQMTELLSIARRIAPADVCVLLTGETGTGKEVLARAIHRASGRGAKPFVPFNCTAVPREMLESQLFGYRKGAFTGAHNAFDGVIRAAAGGTLFLDEIAEIGLDLQPKLLRFLETREVHGLGESHPVKVDVRVIAATNADLEALVADGRFREDLFYRLNVVRLRLPPLRERREEIPPLIDHYLRTFAEQQKKGRLTLDDETLEYLVLYRWPGNVRQLVNEISRIVAYAEADSRITPALLSPELQASRRTVKVMPGDEPEIRVRLDQPLGDAVDAIERVMVVRALERAHGNYENAARLLGISRKGLFLKRRRWGMQRQQAS